MRIKSQKDFFAGLVFTGCGLAFAWGATSYDLGKAARMGPGYFPLLLGILMALLGIVIAFKALAVGAEDGSKIGRWAWKPLVCILAANFVFGVLLCGIRSIRLPAMGMIVAIYGLTVISSLAGARFKLRSALILATIFALVSYFIFVALLRLQLPVWPQFIR